MGASFAAAEAEVALPVLAVVVFAGVLPVAGAFAVLAAVAADAGLEAAVFLAVPVVFFRDPAGVDLRAAPVFVDVAIFLLWSSAVDCFRLRYSVTDRQRTGQLSCVRGLSGLS
ncbi:hypothetical protein N8I71_03000 [Roseibacterium sp. SDUM158016]|uniref:hypothetical protein n=1 Tax=Roseicyclus sediminis TaxID=2980997 RepID=UPI0021D21DE1|nr:hypothetical protein [Roseibacterium sp. SDUM158016]MCU4651780.1 hypothetical protein [Roseibacterium sp. SDUM158016]